MSKFLKFFAWTIVTLVAIAAGFRGAAALRETEDRLAFMPDQGAMVQTNLGEVYVEQSGPEDGIPVLLVHGSVGWARFWYETSDALAKAGYRAIAFDLSPMGYSERDPKHDYSRQTQADRIAALAAALGIKPVLVAHSFGAGSGTEALMRHPDAFAAYIIVDGAIGLGADPNKTLPLPLRSKWLREVGVSLSITNPLALRPLLRAFLHKKDAATRAYLDLLRQPFRVKGTTEALGYWLPTLLEPPAGAQSLVPENYAKIEIPVGILWGAEDTATPLEQGEELQSLITGAQLTVLPGLGHIPQIEDPAAFQKALLDMLGQLQP